MERLRLFIAIELSSDITKQISAIQEEFKKNDYDVKWVKPKNLHLTLRFLGSTDASILTPLIKDLEDIVGSNPSFELIFGKTGAFPNLRSPRILWIGTLKGGEEVTVLAGKINNLVETKFNFPAEKRPFSSHLTFGRVKTLKNKEQLVNQLASYQNIEIGALAVKYISLVQSKLTPEGPVYSDLHKFALGVK